MIDSYNKPCIHFGSVVGNQCNKVSSGEREIVSDTFLYRKGILLPHTSANKSYQNLESLYSGFNLNWNYFHLEKLFLYIEKAKPVILKYK